MKKKVIEKTIIISKWDYSVLWVCSTFFVVMIVLAVFGTNVAPNFLITDSYCDVLIENAVNESFINGTSIGAEYIVAWITSEVTKCNSLPINYDGYNYTLIAAECLNLNITTEDK